MTRTGHPGFASLMIAGILGFCLWIPGATLAHAQASGAGQMPQAVAHPPADDRSTTPSRVNLITAGPLAPEAAFDLTPPLSIYESRLMLNDAQRLLGQTPDAEFQARAPRIDAMLDAVTRYVRWVDETHTTLPAYRWGALADTRLDFEPWRVLALRPRGIMPGITALSLRSYHGDVEIQRIIVIDREKRQWEFTQPMRLKADQPRAQVCFLSLPVDLVEVRVTCRPLPGHAERLPRLIVAAGVSGQPEYGKQAVYHLQLARNNLRGGRREEAMKEIKLAAGLLAEYQKDRRL